MMRQSCPQNHGGGAGCPARPPVTVFQGIREIIMSELQQPASEVLQLKDSMVGDSVGNHLLAGLDIEGNLGPPCFTRFEEAHQLVILTPFPAPSRFPYRLTILIPKASAKNQLHRWILLHFLYLATKPATVGLCVLQTRPSWMLQPRSDTSWSRTATQNRMP